MKNKPIKSDPMDSAADKEDAVEHDNHILNHISSDDICKTLLHRYANSTAPQHRHLCASACAMRSILSEEGIPLKPAAYFAAVLTAVRDADHTDDNGVAALSAFLSILLPLVPVSCVPHSKAKDASSTVISILQSSTETLGTTTVRSLVKCLGFLVLCLDFDDWSAVKMPLEVLLKFSMDRRPKIRKCAQFSVEKAFVTFMSSNIIKKASKFLLCMFRTYVSLDISEKHGKKHGQRSEHIEALHLLNVAKLVVPKLSKKITMKLLSEIYACFGCQFSLFSRHLLALFEVMLEHLDDSDLLSEAEKIISAFSSYISNKKNPIDTIVSTSSLLSKVLEKLHSLKPYMWIGAFAIICGSLAGFVDSQGDTAKRASGILVELINCHIDHKIFSVDENLSCSDMMLTSPKSRAIDSICKEFENVVCRNSDIPHENILKVISELFLRLGGLSHFFMRNIVLNLSSLVTKSTDSPNMNHLQACIGSAVVAMGPEKILSLLPISLNEDSLTCSNTWLIPILSKYVSGSSLQFFMEHISPLAKSIKAICQEVKGSNDLQSYSHDLWNLLPAFCHYPLDTSQIFSSFAQFLMVALKEDPSTHETIAVALQVLVNENRNLLGANEDVKCVKGIVSVAADELIIKCRSSCSCYSKKVASKNIKAMASCSMDLLQAIIEIFFSSPPEKRSYLKQAIECLSSITGGSNMYKLITSLSSNFESGCPTPENEDLASASGREHGSGLEEKNKEKKKRCLAMELASCFVAGADRDHIYKIYDLIRQSLMVKGGICHHEAYMLLSRILKEHSWFSSEKTDELMDILIGVKPPSAVNILRSHFSCLHFLLVHLMKSEEEKAKNKMFLILNEIILTLKNPCEEVRKVAYDMLLALACSFRDSSSTNSENPLHDLLVMIMGYFSGSSPHIMSGAVAVLSLLIYKNAELCLSVPNLLASVLVLLKRKEIEVIKAVLGFIKVFVSSLHANELSKLLPDIANGTLPWSSVSKNHFRSKVRIIFEIIIRKCGADSVNIVVPEKYRGFLNTVEEQRWGRKTSNGDHNSGTAPMPVDSSDKGFKKRKYGDVSACSDAKLLRPSKKTQRGHNINKTDSQKRKQQHIDDKGSGRHRTSKSANNASQIPPNKNHDKRRTGPEEKSGGRINMRTRNRKKFMSAKTGKQFR